MTRKIDTIIVHCSATRASQMIGAATIRKWHTDPKPQGRGWKDIGYAYVIDRFGVIHLGRDLDGDGDVDEEIGAHALGHNAHSIGVCLVGGVAEDGKTPEANFTPHQMNNLDALLGLLKKRHGDDIVIIGHRDLPGVAKACPSFDVAHWLETKEVRL